MDEWEKEKQYFKIILDCFFNPKKNIPPAMTEAIRINEKWLPFINHVWRNCRIEKVREISLLRYTGPMDTSNPEAEYLIMQICALLEDKING